MMSNRQSCSRYSPTKEVIIFHVITSIIVPGSNKIMNIFAGNNDIVIPWKNIKCIGDDLILVEI